jgi:hypothetical protein
MRARPLAAYRLAARLRAHVRGRSGPARRVAEALARRLEGLPLKSRRALPIG